MDFQKQHKNASEWVERKGGKTLWNSGFFENYCIFQQEEKLKNNTKKKRDQRLRKN